MWNEGKFTDIPELADLFWGHLTKNPHYISHGEIQMGVAIDSVNLAENGKEQWIRYITAKICREKAQLPAQIFVYIKEGKILAFCVLEIEEDGAEPYGVICDMLVREELRGGGIGTQMFNRMMDWFKEQGVQDIFLESGVDNHSAHEFFAKHKFVKTSHIFRLQR